MDNRIGRGDSLELPRSRKRFPDACVGLIDFGAPVDSIRKQKLLLQSESESQMTAFDDADHA